MSFGGDITLTGSAAVTNGIALSQTLTSAGTLTINGTLATSGVATLDVARRVAITSAGNDAGLFFTITGTQIRGSTTIAQSEVLAGKSAASAGSIKDYSTISKIAVSGSVASTVTVGTSNTLSSQWIVPTREITPMNIGVLCRTDQTAGGVVYTVEQTMDDPNVDEPFGSSQMPQSSTPPWSFNHPTLSGLSAQGFSSITIPVFAFRLTQTSGAGNGPIILQWMQVGLTQGGY
jgi:hypothetical protein